MIFRHSEWLRCPLDGLALHQDTQRLLCGNGHSFDIARQGYVNLLGPTDKRSRDPGDSKAMVAARQHFLEAGHYQPVSAALTELLHPTPGKDAVIVDAGCGEGYYLAQLHSQLAVVTAIEPGSKQHLPTLIGFDISKWAVQAATRRPIATWLVASNRHIPLAADSADCVLSVFGFPVFEEFYRLLKPGGTVLLAGAGPRHLIELREVLYPTVRNTESTTVQEAITAGFVAGACTSVQFPTAPLSPAEILQLLSMTPHFFRAPQDGKERAAKLDQFSVTVDVEFQILQKPL